MVVLGVVLLVVIGRLVSMARGRRAGAAAMPVPSSDGPSSDGPGPDGPGPDGPAAVAGRRPTAPDGGADGRPTTTTTTSDVPSHVPTQTDNEER